MLFYRHTDIDYLRVTGLYEQFCFLSYLIARHLREPASMTEWQSITILNAHEVCTISEATPDLIRREHHVPRSGFIAFLCGAGHHVKDCKPSAFQSRRSSTN